MFLSNVIFDNFDANRTLIDFSRNSKIEFRVNKGLFFAKEAM